VGSRAVAETSRPVIAAHYWSMYDMTPEAACARAASLGYRGLDLASGDLGNGTRIDLEELAGNQQLARRLTAAATNAGIEFTDFFAALPYPVNDQDRANREANRQLFRALTERLVAMGVPGVTLSPGGYLPDSPEDALPRACDELAQLVVIGRDAGIRVRVEPHLESVADTPARTATLLRETPGLTLTLDYSHFIAAGFAQCEIEPLNRCATHWHARQSRPGRLASEVSNGTIDYARIFDDLRGAGYSGAVTTEYVRSLWQGQDLVDSDRENELMRRELVGLLKVRWPDEAEVDAS